MKCNHCGSENPDGRRFCAGCGAALTEAGQAIEQAAKQAAASVSAPDAPAETVLNKALESAKTAADSVQNAAKKVDFSMLNFKFASQNFKILIEKSGFVIKKLRANRIFRTVVASVLALALVSVAAAGAYNLVGRDLTQALMGEQKYARSVITKALEKSLFSALDYIGGAPAGEKAENIRATVSLEAGIPDSYLEDILDELYPGYARPGYDETELLRLLCNSAFEASFMMNTSAKTPLLSLSGGWKVEGKSILDAELKASGNKLYISVPQLLGDTIGLDLKSAGVDLGELADIGNIYSELISQIFYGSYYSYGYYYGPSFDGGEIEALLAKLGDYTPKLKPILSKAIECAVDELDLSLINGETVEINGKTVKLDVVAVTLTEEDVLRAAIAALESIADNDKALTLLADMSKDFSALGVGRMNAKAVKQAIEDAIEALEDELAYASRYSYSEAIEFSLYINASNGICGVTFLSDYGDGIGFIAKPGTGYELFYGEDFRIYGDLGGMVSYSGDVNIYYRDGRDVIEGKICDFTLSGGLRDFSASVTVKFADIFDLAGMDMGDFVPEIFEDVRITCKISGGPNSAAASVSLSDPSHKAKITGQLSVTTGKKANVNVDDKVKVYSVYDLENRIDTDKLEDNLDKLAAKLDKMGYDISGLVGGLY